ncbi:Spc98 family-domain-containing protein, partial [Spinellus fusiger]
MTSLQLTVFSQQLVTLITGLEENTEEWQKCVERTKNKLTQHQFTSTDEHSIDNTYKQLQEKFIIKGNRPLAEQVGNAKARLLESSRHIGSISSNQTILKYDILSLLLSLSSSPLSANHKLHSSIVQPQKKELTWEEILAEDPLEGDHWLAVESYSSDEGLIETEYSSGPMYSDPPSSRQFRSQTQDKKRTVLSPKEEDAYYASLIQADNRSDPDTLEMLKRIQYWGESYNSSSMDMFSISNVSNHPVMNDACQLSESMTHHYYDSTTFVSLKYIEEADMIREILFLLKGYSGIVFCVYGKTLEEDISHGSYYVNTAYTVRHLSHPLITSLLDMFCTHGNMLADLREQVQCILNKHTYIYGRTCQAFAAEILNEFNEFSSIISDLETQCNYIAHEEDQAISLLQLEQSLHPYLQHFKVLHTVIVNSKMNDLSLSTRQLSIYLISALYDLSMHAQLREDMTMYPTLTHLLYQTLIPYGQLMDDWIFYGTIQGDIANEFYVTRDPDVKDTSLSFWSSAFQLHSLDRSTFSFPCPLLNEHFMARVFFTGKANYLISRIKSNHICQEYEDMSNTKYFKTVLKEALPAHCGLLYTTPRQRTEPLPTKKENVFSMVLFPLAFDPPHRSSSFEIDIEDQHRSKQTLKHGTLLDRDMIHCLEMYIVESYKSSAISLNTLLHQKCDLSRQLQLLASVYLMLEGGMMDIFCETIFQQMDQNHLWYDRRSLNKTFADASSTDEWLDTKMMNLFMKFKNEDKKEAAVSHKEKSHAFYLDSIIFDYRMPWPINNFIRHKTLEEYNKVTVLLLRMKRAKYILEKKTLFQERKKVEAGSNTIRFYALRMRMMWFVNVVWGYLMTTILHSETTKLRNVMAMTTDVDEITILHDQYIGRIVDRCLLNNKSKSIKMAIVQILDLVEQLPILFTTYVQGPQDQITETYHFEKRMAMVEEAFISTNKFITRTLKILGTKGGFIWYDMRPIHKFDSHYKENYHRFFIGNKMIDYCQACICKHWSLSLQIPVSCTVCL